MAQDFSGLVLPEGGSLAARSIQVLILVTVLSLVPALAIMFTCFPFMVTVLSIMRQGIGLQQSPPNMLIVSLALFLTYFVMEPVFLTAWDTGISPLIEGDIEAEAAARATIIPFREFMTGRVHGDTMAVLASLRPETEGITVERPSWQTSQSFARRPNETSDLSCFGYLAKCDTWAQMIGLFEQNELKV